MNMIIYISNMIIPMTIFYIVLYGIIHKSKIYDDFISGASDGIKTVMKIMPTMIGLMMGIGILRSSGFLDFITKYLGMFTSSFGLSPAVIPTIIVRMFSSSAATGLVLDVFKKYGTDSYEGLLSSIMMSCTETIFYTMSIYFAIAKVSKTRWTLTGALISTFAGVIASILIVGMLF